MTSATSSMAIAEPTASRRRRSTSRRRNEAPITTTGSATTHGEPPAERHSSVDRLRRSPPASPRAAETASHSHSSRRVSRRASRLNGATTTRSRMLSRNPRSSAIRKRRRRDAIRAQPSEARAAWSRAVADGVLDSVQIVEHVRRAQELQQPKAGVPGEVDERDRVPADRDLDDDDADLGEGGIGQRRLHVALHARRDRPRTPPWPRRARRPGAAPRAPARAAAPRAAAESSPRGSRAIRSTRRSTAWGLPSRAAASSRRAAARSSPPRRR